MPRAVNRLRVRCGPIVLSSTSPIESNPPKTEMIRTNKETLTVDDALEILREMIAAKDAAGKPCTVPFEVTIHRRGQLTIHYQPPKIRLSKLKASKG